MKKMILTLALSFLSQAAFASSGINCHNAVTGAEFGVLSYADQPLHFTANSALIQDVPNFPAQGDGGAVLGRAWDYAIAIDSKNYVTFSKQDDGRYLVRYQNHPFYFNSNECHSW